MTAQTFASLAFIAIGLWVLYGMCRYYGRNEITVLGIFGSDGRRLDNRSTELNWQPVPIYARQRRNPHLQVELLGPDARVVRSEDGRIISLQGPCRLTSRGY
ncbi:MAG: hypothetical protein KGS72_13690 [Cyanobacteria bacterium REEB67]|nr:hypothetical protein [Cyanobacteria bacterium REEB67]